MSMIIYDALNPFIILTQLTPFLKWFNGNPGVDKWSHAQQNVERIFLSISKLQRFYAYSLGIDK